MVDHLGGALGMQQEIDRIWSALRALSSASPLASASIGRGGIRVYDGGVITIQNGGLQVVGWVDVNGEIRIAGTLTGDGTIIWTGTATFDGDTDITGDLDIVGPTQIDGPTTVNGQFWINGTTHLNGPMSMNGDLTLLSGKIVGGGLTIEAGDINFDTGGQLSAYASGIGLSHGSSAIYTAGSNAVLEAGSASLILSSAAASINTNLTIIGDIFATGDVGGGSKSFWIEHPTKPGKMLRHGSVEGPTHSVEYSGTTTLDPQGEAIVHLPDYFEALTLPEGRTVHVTPIGRPFMVGAEPVVDGQFTAYGDPNRNVSWMVKATRELFDTEPDARQSAANSVQ